METKAMVLVDIENLVGCGLFTQEMAEAEWCRLRTIITVRDDDFVQVGVSSSQAGLAAGLAMPGALLRIRWGRDGAERALLAEFDLDWIAAHCHEVFVVSGDGAFAGAMSELARRKVFVTCVADPTGVSRRSLVACHRFIPLTWPTWLDA